LSRFGKVLSRNAVRRRAVSPLLTRLVRNLKKEKQVTKKDYVKLAAAIKEGGATPDFVETLMEVLEADNPRFDRKTFLIACGLK
jgi:hypothetical protein